MAMWISNKTDFKIKVVTTDKEAHFKITKISIHQDDIILNIIYLTTENQNL